MSAGSEGVETQGSSGRPLGVAALTVLFSVVILIVAIAAFGSAEDGDPVVSLELPPPAQGEQTAPLPAFGQASRSVAGNLVSDLALVEETPDGPVPKIGEDGRTVMQAYARAFTAPAGLPRIAIVVTGLGIGANATTAALTRLPPDIAVSFVPFVPDLQRMVDEARARGHEVLLEVPMEPFDFPNSDPGPNVLMVGASGEENAKRLNWALSRSTGYVGIANLLGGRFLGENGAIEPVLAILARRGILFFDTGIYSNSVAATAARRAGTVSAAGVVALDMTQTPGAIDSRLAELEDRAREGGFAVGTASVYPVTIDRIVEWTAGLQARGFVLAPLTAVASDPEYQARR